MGIFKTNTITINEDDGALTIIEKESWSEFSEQILDLGNVSQKSKTVNAISVMFDLEGFTNFCTQMDPHLIVPEFLSEFLKWIFKEIKNQLLIKERPEGCETFASLPFLSKFLGDGLLFLWGTDDMDESEILNIISGMYELCKNYKKKFYPTLVDELKDMPKVLRCGIARGAIYSVGNGNDYVGPCINMSARLQKLSTLNFCFYRKGLKPTDLGTGYADMFITKKTNVRGIGDDEVVCILKDEFAILPPEEKKKFK